MNRVIRIGTRDSELALWQATTVQKQLEHHGYKTELVPVKSTGDLVLDKPLYELGITGIFTKTLDVAMLNGTVDIAVHSMKDVPTALPIGIVQAAVLERAATQDLLVHKGTPDYTQDCIIATGSLRRQAQWLNKYPHHQTTDLRGNVNTRLQKLDDSDWTGAIFAKAGLERINILPSNYEVLDWMTPAPAQGAMLIVALENDDFSKTACAKLNHEATALCTHIEREFLRTLEGGCTAPIGAIANIKEETIHFTGVLFSLDGKTKLEVNQSVSVSHSQGFGVDCALEILDNGGRELMKEIKASINKK
ncbi:hydroxymethylbilane synthase [Dokdonia pacifica]|uniref:Hydroxymethylbilane synthase n=1 Tax=Dokdonia pacifica TaxID=1627892 RepID=A0A238WBF2_9FLAO|nr:hydroxymethylbilane synthase [Dokdonia pacifica]GGG13297.1 hydroxymethylbilane synthase [Dokdonia pacifica]SNR43882.1 hydroxymethylbilane synthase [Dokdonia pacifica]